MTSAGLGDAGALSSCHTEPGGGSSAAFNFALGCDDGNHWSPSCFRVTPRHTVSVWWSPSETWKTWSASRLGQTCCMSLWHASGTLCWSLGVISQNKASEVFMRLLLRNLSYVAEEGMQQSGLIVCIKPGCQKCCYCFPAGVRSGRLKS